MALAYGWAGLRVPSKTHILTWADVDWKRGRLSVYSPKTERYDQHWRRTVPIAPKLMWLLQDAYDATEDGVERALGLSRNNLHGTLRAILKRAEIEAWDELFQTLRQSCEMELSLSFPQHAVSAWLDHSEKVSKKHYLMIPDEVWDRASELVDPIAAVGSRIDSQGVANGQSANNATPHESPCIMGLNARNSTSGARDRTGDLGFMNPTL